MLLKANISVYGLKWASEAFSLNCHHYMGLSAKSCTFGRKLTKVQNTIKNRNERLFVCLTIKSLWDVDRDVSTAILPVFIRRWGRLSTCSYLCTSVRCDWCISILIIPISRWTWISSLRQKFKTLVAKEQQMDQENRLPWAASFMYQCIILN